MNWQLKPTQDHAVNPYWRQYELRAGERLIASVNCTNALGDGQANAAVIGAAQEMLEALRATRDGIAAWSRAPGCSHDAREAMQIVLARVELIIKVAEGGAKL